MNKLIVVTGGTKGIGLAIVRKFMAEGFDVITCSRNEEQLYRLKDELERLHKDRKVFVFRADLANRQDTAAFGEFVLQQQRPVDVLVNNAGYFIPGEIHREPEGNLEQMINANLFSAYHLTRALIEQMKAHKKGHIFNMCSVASFMAYPDGGSYAISKFALLGFSKCLRAELKDHGLRVTAVMPGATYTASWEGEDLPEERLMPPEDVATMLFATWSLSGRSVVEELVLRPQLGDI